MIAVSLFSWLLQVDDRQSPKLVGNDSKVGAALVSYSARGTSQSNTPLFLFTAYVLSFASYIQCDTHLQMIKLFNRTALAASGGKYEMDES